MKKTILSMTLVCMVATTAFAQNESKVVVRSGDVVVTAAELESAVSTLPEEYRAYAAGPGKKSFAEDLLRMKRLAKAAEDNGVADDPDVKAQLALSRANTLANAEVERMRDAITIDEERVKTLYEERKSQFERAKARHILIAFEGSPAASEDALSEEAAKAKAEEILEQVKAGEDFAELARATSDDKGSGARGGELGEFGRGQMVPEFEAAVFNTEPGELAPVVRTQFGYHVIQVQEKSTMSLEDVREQIETELKQQELQKQIESLGEGAEVTFDATYFTAPKSVPPADSEGS